MAERKLWFARLVCGAGLRQLQKMLQQSRVHKCFCHPLVHVLAKTVCIKTRTENHLPGQLDPAGYRPETLERNSFVKLWWEAEPGFPT